MKRGTLILLAIAAVIFYFTGGFALFSNATYVFVSLEIKNITGECADGETGGNDIGNGYEGFPVAFRSNTDIPITVRIEDTQGNLMGNEKNYPEAGLWGGKNVERINCTEAWPDFGTCTPPKTCLTTSCGADQYTFNATGNTLVSSLVNLQEGNDYIFYLNVRQARVFAPNITYNYSDYSGAMGYDFGCGGFTVLQDPYLGASEYQIYHYCNAELQTLSAGLRNATFDYHCLPTSSTSGINIPARRVLISTGVTGENNFTPEFRLSDNASAVLGGRDLGDYENGTFRLNFTFS